MVSLALLWKESSVSADNAFGWRSAAQSYVKAVHSVEVRSAAGLETIHLQERVDRQLSTPEQYKNQCWLIPGMRIVVEPRGVEIEKGIKKFTCASGDMFVLRSGTSPAGGGANCPIGV